MASGYRRLADRQRQADGLNEGRRFLERADARAHDDGRRPYPAATPVIPRGDTEAKAKRSRIALRLIVLLVPTLGIEPRTY